MGTAIGIFALLGIMVMVILIVHRSKEKYDEHINLRGDDDEPCHSYQATGTGIVTYEDCNGHNTTLSITSSRHFQASRIIYHSQDVSVVKIV